MPETSNRKDWIDTLRAFAMLLVIIGHVCDYIITDDAGLPAVFADASWLFAFFNAVKLPVFFIISGYLFKSDAVNTPGKFVLGKIKRLLVPYACLSILADLPQLATDALKGRISSHLIIFFEELFLGKLLWFIPCLFLCEILTLVLVKLTGDKPVRIGICGIVLAVCGFAVSALWTSGAAVFWHADTALIMTAIMLLGHLFRGHEDFYTKRSRLYFGLIFLGVYIASVIVGVTLYGMSAININTNEYFCIPLNAISMLAGPLSLLMLVYYVPSLRAVTYVGRNTLTYYGLHKVLVTFMVMALSKISFMSSGIFSALVITVVSCFILVIPTEILNRFLPFTVGRKRVRKTGEDI